MTWLSDGGHIYRDYIPEWDSLDELDDDLYADPPLPRCKHDQFDFACNLCHADEAYKMWLDSVCEHGVDHAKVCYQCCSYLIGEEVDDIWKEAKADDDIDDLDDLHAGCGLSDWEHEFLCSPESTFSDDAAPFAPMSPWLRHLATSRAQDDLRSSRRWRRRQDHGSAGIEKGLRHRNHKGRRTNRHAADRCEMQRESLALRYSAKAAIAAAQYPPMDDFE